MATDLAIALLAQDGWSGMTLAAIATRGNMRRQSVAQWFGNVEALREQVAWRFARRWLVLLSAQLTPLYRVETPEPATVARLLLPETDDGIVFARIWHTMVEAHLPEASRAEIHAVCALVTGLRARLCTADPISRADARAATAVLRR